MMAADALEWAELSQFLKQKRNKKISFLSV